jgi:hypothetical protein
MMSDPGDGLDLSTSPHILPLRTRTDELLQVLLPEFTVRKNRQGPGLCLSIEIKDHMHSIGDVHGKGALYEIVGRAGTHARNALAHDLHDFFKNPRLREYRFDCSGHPLRFANGGVLPVVRLDGRDYFWLFYRDIFPIGWNIANGASDNVAEMLDPNRIVLREFGEEVIVVDFATKHLFTFEPEDEMVPLGFLKGAIEAWSKRLGVDLFKFHRLPIPLKWVDGPDTADVDVEGRRRETKGYFVNITPEDNAIELDRIALVNLGKGVTLLDGENRNGKLLNEVIGLFEVEKMRDLSRAEFIPDLVFFSGNKRPLDEGGSAGQLEELAVIVEEYFKNPDLDRSNDLRLAYRNAPIKFDLCPITRAVIERFFEWEKEERETHPPEPEPHPRSRGRFEIFISFRDPDLPIALGLAENLERRGFNVFMSYLTLKRLGAADYKRAISEALDESAVLIVVGTRPEYLKSGWVSYEWQSFFAETHTDRKNFGRVFSFLGGVGVDELPFDLRQVQAVKYDPTAPEASFNEMAKYIGPREKIWEPRHESKP